MARLTPAQKRLILSMFENGKSMKEISEETEIVYNTVRYTLDKAGAREAKAVPMRDDYIDTLLQLFNQGMLLTEIAEVTGLIPQTVSDWLRESGVVIGRGSGTKRMSAERRAELGDKISAAKAGKDNSWSDELRKNNLAARAAKNEHLWEDRKCIVGEPYKPAHTWRVRKINPQLACSMACSAIARTFDK